MKNDAASLSSHSPPVSSNEPRSSSFGGVTCNGSGLEIVVLRTIDAV
jgi:hypothetical protein